MIDRIRSRARALQFGRAALTMLALPFLFVGVLGGGIWRLLRLLAGAIVEGFAMGSKDK